jgi:hypothetical protein
MKKLSFLHVGLAMIAIQPWIARAEIVSFDPPTFPQLDYPGTLLTTQLNGIGLDFQGGGFTVIDNTFGNGVSTSTPPNYLNVGTGLQKIVFISGAASDGLGAVDGFSFTLGAIDANVGRLSGATVTTYDADGNLLDSQTIAPVEPNASRGLTTFTDTQTGINEIDFTISPTVGNGDYGAFPIDDLTFGNITPDAAPEPGTFGLLLSASGLLALALKRRKAV